MKASKIKTNQWLKPESANRLSEKFRLFITTISLRNTKGKSAQNLSAEVDFYVFVEPVVNIDADGRGQVSKFALLRNLFNLFQNFRVHILYAEQLELNFHEFAPLVLQQVFESFGLELSSAELLL